VSRADQAIALAQTEIGKPYSYGSDGPNSFDCSGLMQFIYAHVGIKLPRTAAQQQDATTATAKPRPGDLVFYGNPAHHVALYIGGGKQIAAPHTGAFVRIENVYSGVSNYGRVSGAGVAASVAAKATATNAALNASAGDLFDTAGLISGFQEFSFKAAFGLLGIGLIGFGAYRTFGKQITSDVGKALK
jgi:hypothetical protein